MSTQGNYYENFQDFLDEVQYSRQGVARYEWIFGEGYLSTGGLETTQEIVPLLKLEAGHRVLDVGCGLGGHDFYMAEKYGVIIDAVDLSKNMMSVALHHFSKKPHIANNIKFRICDITSTPLEENYYDVIYSRDALLHIAEKEKLFEKFYKWLKPGGKIVFTDYCRGNVKHSEEFAKYVAQRSYCLFRVREYEDLLKRVGFTKVKVEDIHNKFVASLTRELNKLYDRKKEFLQKFNSEDFDYLEEGWLAKLKRAKDGDQTWCLAYAEKSLE